MMETLISQMDKLIITVAPTGGFHGKEANPALPEQPEEIAQAAYDCWNEGAAVLHIHARDAAGRPTGDPSILREIHKLVRERCDLIIQDSTGLGPGYSDEERLRPLEADPEVASLNMGSMVRLRFLEGTVALNSRQQIERFATLMLEKGIKPEMEVYSHSMMEDVYNLIDKRLVKKPYIVNFVLGMSNQGALRATPKNLLSMVEYLPKDSIFGTTAVGASQTQLMTLSLVLGGNVRVGMEDNIYYSRGKLAASNAELVARVVRIAREVGREIATPDEARRILVLKGEAN